MGPERTGPAIVSRYSRCAWGALPDGAVLGFPGRFCATVIADVTFCGPASACKVGRSSAQGQPAGNESGLGRNSLWIPIGVPAARALMIGQAQTRRRYRLATKQADLPCTGHRLRRPCDPHCHLVRGKKLHRRASLRSARNVVRAKLVVEDFYTVSLTAFLISRQNAINPTLVKSGTVLAFCACWFFCLKP